MHSLKTLSRNTLCWIISLMIALQPNLAEAQQAVITVDPSSKASMDKTLNNTPLLNIVAPNASGVSHNKFTDFNVGKPGLVINNSLQDTNTKIGGAILGNQNFNGRSASLILNEVTSSNRSRLEGFTEIAGDKADYILANPNGITCNGCGFINTSRSTLTTGTPTFNGTALESLSVEGGDILIDSLGLNASETDAFDIITRAAKIGGVLQGKDVRVVAGRNNVKYDDLSVTKKADDGSLKPSLAIDSTALGGMYAGRIALIANETGVGVNMQGDLAASSSELTLSAGGKIVLNNASAQNDLNVTSNTAIEVDENGQVYAGNDLSLKGGDVNVTSATLAAANDVSLTGHNITTTNSTLAAGQQSDGSAGNTGDLTLNATGTLSAEGGSLSSVETLTLKGNTITDGTGANGLKAKGDISIVSTTSTALNGDIQSGGDVTATSNSITVKNMSAGGAVNIEATDNATATGHLQAGTKATLSGKTITTNTITAGDDVSLTATTTATLSGKTQSNKNITVTAPTLNAGELVAVGDLTLKGSTSATTTGDMTVGGDLSLTGGALSTSGGAAEIGGNTTIDGTTYTAKNTLETGGTLKVTTTGNTVVETGAQLIANETASINAQNITTDGTISSQTGTTLTATQGITATANAKTQSATDTSVTAGTTLSNAGMLTASEQLTLTAANITNTGTLASGSTETMVVEVTSDLTNSGLIYTPGDLTFKTPGSLTNDEGDILADGNIQIDADGNGTKNTKVWNYSGNIESLNGGITINTEELLNERKNLAITSEVTGASSYQTQISHNRLYGSAGSADPNYGKFYNDGGPNDGSKTYVTLYNYTQTTTSETTANSDKPIAKLISSGNLTVNASDITNKGGQIVSNANITLTGSTLTNSGFAKVTTSTSITRSPKMTGEYSHDTGWNNANIVAGDVASTSSTSTVTDPGDTFITAGGDITGSFTDKIDNVSIFGGADPVTISQGSANIHATSADIGLPTAETINSNVALPKGVGGMFLTNTTKGAEYAIVTNPAIASLNALYSSDYFIDRMGTDVQEDMETTLRLGDAAWEMYSVRNQIMATTHQRFLSPNVTSDADQYKALMDNALAQNESLELSYGVALTPEQINALTDDIVWMVEVTLEDGRKALKPVVYFAEATRLAIDSSGALIKAGGNLTLTAANDITNSGTLSGANTDLTSTERSLINDYGKLAATDGNLNVTTDQNIINTGGLLTSEGNITLAAANGNVTNTTETWRQSETRAYYGDKRVTLDYQDVKGASARIKSKGDLTVKSGQDITAIAAEIEAVKDVSFDAGGTVQTASIKEETQIYDDPILRWQNHVQRDQKVVGTTITGKNVTLNAGQNIILEGGKTNAEEDLKLSSGQDTIILASQEKHDVQRGILRNNDYWSKGVTNKLAELNAGKNIIVTSGLDTIINGAEVTAGEDLKITSLVSTTINSPQDSFEQDITGKKYSLKVDKKTTVRSELTAGNDLTVQATLGDVTLTSADLKSGGKTTLASLNGDVNIRANKDIDFYHESGTETGGMWTTVFDRGHIHETVQHTTIDAGDGLTISVGTNGSVNIDYKDFGDLDKSVERLSKEPGLEWMAQVKASATPQQWNAIKEAHKSWDYSSQSLSPAAGMIIAIAATIATMGAASGAATVMMGLAEGAKMTAMQTAVHAALTAGMTSLASSAAVSLVGNKGNLGATLKQLGSSRTLRSLATSMVSAGLVAGIGNAATINMNPTELVERIQVAALKMSVNTAVQSTIGGQDLSDTLKYNLISAGVQVIGGELSEQIGKAAKGDDINQLTRYLAHAALGCASGAALGGDCGSGAAGAVVGEMIGDAYVNSPEAENFQKELLQNFKSGDLTKAQALSLMENWKQRGVDISRLVAGMAVAVAGGNVNIAATASDNAVENNAIALAVPAFMALLEAAEAVLIGTAAGGALIVLSENSGGQDANSNTDKDPQAGKVHTAPDALDAFPDAKEVKRKTPVKGGGGKRKRWKDKKGKIYEWDSQHGTVEKYSKKGKHLGEFDPQTGKQTKPADPTRKVDP